MNKINMDTLNLFEEKAQLCKTKETKYRKLRKSAAKEERYMKAFLEQCKVMQIPSNKLDRFEELYKDAFSRISMIRKAKRKEWNGKVRYAGDESSFVGPSMGRMVQYLAEVKPVQPHEDMVMVLKDLKCHMHMAVYADEVKDCFEFVDYVNDNDQITIRDLSTFNIVNLRNLAKIIPASEFMGFCKTLRTKPWLRCTAKTSKWIYNFCVNTLISMWEQELCVKLPRTLCLGKQEKVPYIRFKLSTDDPNDNKWHTCETRALADLVARQFNATIISIEEVDPYEYKSVEIKTEEGQVIKTYVKYDGEWADKRQSRFSEIE